MKSKNTARRCSVSAPATAAQSNEHVGKPCSTSRGGAPASSRAGRSRTNTSPSGVAIVVPAASHSATVVGVRAPGMADLRTDIRSPVVPIDLAALLDPAHTALVTQECQNGVIGDAAVLRQLADEAQRLAVPNIVRLAAGAHEAGAHVVHAVAVRRADDKGSNANAALFIGTRKLGIRLEPGSPEADLIPELFGDPSDLVLSRYHGLGPMGGTDLNAVLRNLGVTTIVGVGVSVNVAITNFAMDAVNAGYQFVLPRDAVAGYPAEYAEAVIANTLSLIATVVTTDDVLAVWKGS